MTPAAVLDILVKVNNRQAMVGLKSTDAQLRKTETQTKKSGKAFAAMGTLAKTGGLALSAGLAVGLKKASGEAREAAKVGRQTNAVLKSTGGAAKVSRKEIEGLAQAISEKSGMDDEAIQSAENLLLTFTKVRNETGRGNKIFSQATSVITDMSVALDQDLKSSTIQVGKALNDPIKGITALQRVGVSFTAKQKEMVAGWVESGNTLKAQRFILAELKTEFGGSAAAQADGLDRLKVTVNNLLETLGGPLNTALNKAADATARFLSGLQSGQGGGGVNFGAAISSQFDRMRQAAGLSAKDVQAASQAMSNAWTATRDVAARVWPAIRQILQGGLRIMGGLVKIFSGVLTADFGRTWSGLKQIVSGALKSMGGSIRGASAPFRAAAAAAFGPIKSVATSVFNGVKKVVGDAIAGMLRRFAALFNVASKIPGIGSKFKGLRDDANAAADKIDRMGESVRKLPKSRQVKVSLKMVLAGKQDVPIPGLATGSPQGLEKLIARAGQGVAAANPSFFGPMPGAGGGPLMGGVFKGATYRKAGAIARKFGLRITSGYRDPKRNAAAGGVPGSLHTHGSPSNPGAIDLVGAPADMYKALAYARAKIKGLKEALVHDAGSGLHLHLGFFEKGGKVARSQMAVVGEKGPELVSLPQGAEVFSHSRSKRMVSAAQGMVPGFANGGLVGAARKYFKGNTLKTMLAIALAESGGRLRAWNRKGEDSRGPWQINVGPGANPDLAGMPLFTYAGNAKAARIVLNRQGFNAWTMYKNRTYLKYLDDAARMLAGGAGRARRKAAGKGGGGILGSRGLSPGQLFANRKAVTGRSIPLEGFGKGQPFTSGRPPRTITPLSQEQLESVGGDTSGASGPSPAELLDEHIKELTEQVKALKDEQTKTRLVAESRLGIGLREAERALADVFARELGTQATQRGRTPGDGRLARY